MRRTLLLAPSIAQGFDLHEDDRWFVILEEDRIRFLPPEEGIAFRKARQTTRSR